MENLIKLLKFIILFAVIGGVLLLTRCDQKPNHLVYVVPDGYRGVLKLRSERADGQLIEASNHVVTCFFPNSGILNIQGKLPTLGWHYHEGRYANGKIIPVPAPGKEMSGDEIALRSLGLTDDGKESWDIIGTEADMVEASRKMWEFSPGKRPEQKLK